MAVFKDLHMFQANRGAPQPQGFGNVQSFHIQLLVYNLGTSIDVQNSPSFGTSTNPGKPGKLFCVGFTWKKTAEIIPKKVGFDSRNWASQFLNPGWDLYPLVICYIAMEAMALIKIDDFPSERNLHLWLGFSMANCES